MIGDQGAGPEQAGFGERLSRDNDARAKLEPAGPGVGLTLDRGAQLQCCFADLDAVPEHQTKPVENGRVDHRTKSAFAPVERSGEVLHRRQR